MNWSSLGFGRKNLDATVTEIVEQSQFPTRQQVLDYAGSPDEFLFDSFLFMYALSFGHKDKLGKHAPAHYVDASHVANARFDESGFRLAAKQIGGTQFHDIPEDIGKLLAGGKKEYAIVGALVLSDYIDHLMSKKVGIDYRTLLKYLTPSGDMIFRPVHDLMEKRITVPGQQIKPDNDITTLDELMAKLEEYYGTLHISPQRIANYHQRILERVEHVGSLVEKQDYLEPRERDFQREKVTSFAEEIRRIKKETLALWPSQIEVLEAQEYEGVRDVLKTTTEFPRELISPNQSPLLMDKKFALYRRYVGNMFDAALQYLRDNSSGFIDPNSPQMTAPVFKPLDQRDVVTRDSSKPESIVSFLYKGITTLDLGQRMVRTAYQEGLDPGNIPLSLKFLNRAVEEEISDRIELGVEKARRQTRNADLAKKIEVLSGLLKDLDFPRYMQPPSKLRSVLYRTGMY